MTRRSPRRIRLAGKGTKLMAIGIGACLFGAVILASVPFDSARAGRFPHTADGILSPVERWLQRSRDAESDLALAPIAGFPLWEEGARMDGRGETDQARALISEAVRRDPQLAAARVWLATDAAKRARFSATVDQLDWLFALSPQARPQIVHALAELAKLPAARASVIAAANRQPLWRQSVADELMKSNAVPSVVFALLGGADRRAGSAVVGDSGLVPTLVARGLYDQAYLAWVSALPSSALGAVGYVYDHGFQQLPGARPFNWTLEDSTAASVDFVKGGGVHIAYFGESPAHFLDQLLVLQAGRYRFLTVTNNPGVPNANKVVWSIYCGADRSRTLGRIDVATASHGMTSAFDFDVPPSCPAQTLSLDGMPVDISSAAEIDVKSATIVDRGGAQ